jgi:hypothetical protein
LECWHFLYFSELFLECNSCVRFFHLIKYSLIIREHNIFSQTLIMDFGSKTIRDENGEGGELIVLGLMTNCKQKASKVWDPGILKTITMQQQDNKTSGKK